MVGLGPTLGDYLLPSNRGVPEPEPLVDYRGDSCVQFRVLSETRPVPSRPAPRVHGERYINVCDRK